MMKNIFFILIMLLSTQAFAQDNTVVRGQVTDASTGEELPFVNVIFKGKKIGTTTDMNGRFEIHTLWASDKLEFSFMGYETQIVDVKIGDRQTFNIKLKPEATQIDAVMVRPKKTKYKKKGNPAVDIMRKAIDNKKNNRIEARQYYQYETYEKLELALNNIKPSLKEKKSMKNFQFLFDYVDTSQMNGKPYLPVFLKETISERYYRKSPETSKEIIKASQISGFEKYFDQAGISSYLELMLNYINIYDNDIDMLNQRFVSPLSNIAPTFYKFYLTDTTEVDGVQCYNISFLPFNPADWGFNGTVMITADSAYAVKKITMNILNKINLNFVDDMQLMQEYKKVDSTWVLSKDQIILDFSLISKNQGIYGKRTGMYKDFVFDKPRPDADYKGVDKKIRLPDSDEKSKSYWVTARHEDLNREEQGVFQMFDTLQNVKQFKTFMNLLMVVVSGYVECGKFDIGPVASMYSKNEIEGNRFRLGFKTNALLNKQWFFEGYGAYGLKDKKFKYETAVTYSFNKKKYYQGEYPMKLLTVSYSHNTRIPGQQINYSTNDNFFLSFTRGKVDKMVYDRKLKILYENEMKNGLGLRLTAEHNVQKPAGLLNFTNYDAAGNLNSIDKLTTSELSVRFRYAPNEQFYQNKRSRSPMTKDEPVITLTHTAGFKNVFGSDYNYQNTQLGIQKRIRISSFGYVNALIKGGMVWGKAPFPLLFIHNANQTYSYDDEAYNMMNFLEFVSDKYVSVNLAYYLQGLILNRIPLLKHFKLREVVTFKSVWGGMSKKNKPENDRSLFIFPSETYVLNGQPYMEGSVGIDNIFKVLRIDLVKRFSYRDHKDVGNIGIRFKLHMSF